MEEVSILVVVLQRPQVVRDQRPESPLSCSTASDVISGSVAVPSLVCSLDHLSLVHLDRKNRLDLQQSGQREVAVHSASAVPVLRIFLFRHKRGQQPRLH